MNKRRAIYDINPSGLKRAKTEHSVATHEPSLMESVLAIPELIDTIMANYRVGYNLEHTAMTSLVARMLAFTSKRIYEACAGCASRNYHSYLSSEHMKRFAAGQDYYSCFKYLQECNPTPPPLIVTGSKEIIQYARSRGYTLSDGCNIMAIKLGDLDALKIMNEIFPCDKDDLLEASGSGNIELLKYVHEELKVDVNVDAIKQSLRRGNLECTEYLIRKYKKVLSPSDKVDMLTSAIMSPDLECVKHCINNYPPPIVAPYGVVGVALRSSKSRDDIEKCITYLRTVYRYNTCLTAACPSIWQGACEKGLVSMLKYYLKPCTERARVIKGQEDSMIAQSAAGGVECLKFAHENFGRIPTDTAFYIRRDDVETFTYFLDNHPNFTITEINNTKWLGPRTLRIAYERGVSLTSSLCSRAVMEDDAESLKFLLKKNVHLERTTVERAIKCSLPCLKVIHRSGRVVDWNTVKDVWVKAETSECIKYGLENGLCHVGMLGLAVSGFSLDVIRFMEKRGWVLDPLLCNAACFGGRSDLLAYAHKRGVPINSDCMLRAIDSRSLECVVYLHKSGIQLNTEDFTEAAVISRNKRVFAYLVDNGCPCDTYSCLELLLQKDRDTNKPAPTVEYLKSMCS